MSTLCSDAQTETDTGFVAKRPVVFRDKKKKDLRFSKWAFEYKLRTNGWNVGLNYVYSDKKNKDNVFKSLTIFNLGLGYVRAGREAKTTSFTGGGVKFGKINALYPIELSVGKRRSIGRRAVHEGVGVQWEYKAGLLIGWLLPYQLETAYGNIPEYNSATAIAYEDFYSIYRGLGSFRNLDFSTIYPGLRLETNVIFNYIIRKRYHLTPIIGASLSFFTKSVPIMFTEPSGPLFFDMHVGVEIGRFKIK